MVRMRGWRWGVMVGAFVLIGVGVSSCFSRAPEVIPLHVVTRELIEEGGAERLYSLVFEDQRGDRVDAYLRKPVERPGVVPEGPMPAVVLVAGRYTGREAAKLIPGPLQSVMLAVEYPQTIPSRMGVSEWMRSLPAIRRSARRMPGILSGAARSLAEFPEVDGTRLGLVGVSFGVPFAAAAGRDRVFSAVALHYGGSNLGSLFRANLPLENRLMRGTLATFAGWWFREMDPGRHVARISPTPLLLINATADVQIPRASAERLARRARPPVRHIWLPYGHLTSGQLDVIREVADSTFRYFGHWSDAETSGAPVPRSPGVGQAYLESGHEGSSVLPGGHYEAGS